MVIPSCARSRMTPKTSRTSSGSSAEVASSKSMTCGFIDRARAMATRCCWPPESWLGIKSIRSARPTLVSSSMAIFSASSLLRLSTFCCASMTFFLTERCGNKLNCWNTIPRCVRTLLRSTPLAHTSTPSTIIEPLVGCSRRLMQRSIVDLPEPEGPKTTTTSPLCTSRSMSRRTTLSPKAFWRFLMLTTTSFELLVSLMIGPPYRPAM